MQVSVHDPAYEPALSRNKKLKLTWIWWVRLGRNALEMLFAYSAPLLASNSTFLAIRILIEEKRQYRSLVWWWTKEITHSNRTQNMLPFVGEYHKIVLSRNTVKKYFFNIFYILVYFILLLLFLVIYYINLSCLTFNLKIQ